MQITTFKNKAFGQIRTIQDEMGEAWFCAKDVCGALGYARTDNAVRQHVEPDDALKQCIVDSLGRRNAAIFINESGLYALIMGSKLESARRFKHWVTRDVLPSIMRQGYYMVGPDEKELARYAARVLEAEGCLTTTQIAKELEMSATELNQRLIRLGIQYHQSGQYMLYAEYARRGYARNRTHTRRDALGRLCTETYLVWTERGRRFIHMAMNPIMGREDEWAEDFRPLSLNALTLNSSAVCLE